MPTQTLELIGLLVQIHQVTHPQRLARHFGITPEYVRRQWRYRLQENCPDMAQTLARLKDFLQPARSGGF